MRFLTAAAHSLLIECADLDETLALHAALEAEAIPGVEELVPAARTVLVRFRPAALTAGELERRVRSLTLSGVSASAGTLVRIPVSYTGEDLPEVAALLGIDTAELIRRHSGAEYSVAFTGFAPGFAYLSGGHASLDVPRRPSPRTRIPAGSVGLAGTFSAVYPTASPGGWQLIGTTDAVMWDLDRPSPALLQPGYRVRFVDAREPISAAAPAAAASAPAAAASVPAAAASVPAAPAVAPEAPAAVEVLAAGLQSVLQDLGRPGLAGMGVSASGALDRGALRRANRLVGNPGECAAIETVGGGLVLRAARACVLAVTGAVVELTLTGADGREREARLAEPLGLEPGDELRLGAPARGVRSYVAARGGVAVPEVLGSRSWDSLAQLGPSPLVPGQALPLGSDRGLEAVAIGGADSEPEYAAPGETVWLDVLLGPREDWFRPESLDLLLAQGWEVTPRSSRVGLRLEGALPLERAITRELPSEGTVVGAIQVPAGGQPVLFLADHPLTGGYPVIASIAPHDLDRAGQAPPGSTLRFRPLPAPAATR